MRDLRGGVAVITGAASGIGRALAIKLGALGAELALADVDAAGLDETRKLLGQAKARPYTVDVANAPAMQNFVSQVERDFGRASVLINNAGVALHGNFRELTLEEMEWLIGINFWGVVHGCKFFLRLLEREPEAHIVNLSSVFGLIGPPGQIAYCSSKFAVRGFSDCLREELRGSSVKVTCVYPGGIATRIAERARAGAATRREDQERARRLAAQALRIPPEKAAQTIVRGILHDKSRVLIGPEAYWIDIFGRLFPERATAIFSAGIQKRLASKETPKISAGRQGAL